jgi:chromatin remodeling complex protein RSC6
MAEVDNAIVSDMLDKIDLLSSKTELSPCESLKMVLTVLNEHMAKTKTLATYVRATMKVVDRQTKDLDKLRNKSSRAKTERKNNGVQSGITKPVPISDELAFFLGKSAGTRMSRVDVSKEINRYIREKGLADTVNGRKINPDEKLRNLLDITSEFELTYFNLQRCMRRHFIR